jgi:hypothetical protein
MKVPYIPEPELITTYFTFEELVHIAHCMNVAADYHGDHVEHWTVTDVINKTISDEQQAREEAAATLRRQIEQEVQRVFSPQLSLNTYTSRYAA